MAELNRRRFLQLAGGATALTMLSDSIARAAAIPAQGTTGSIQDVEHIVVLMQENRSFDHYFGAMKGVRGFGDPRPVTLPSGKSVWACPRVLRGCSRGARIRRNRRRGVLRGGGGPA
ncbi:alkaline phosphatase family protein, partial [Streptomyces sp. NPDC029004]|uniref:alkaline phosphatase family protein n=1 Tax=Streptomyces sp. NPDC029004 TaxID=3154490 RepID=UPI0033D18E94